MDELTPEQMLRRVGFLADLDEQQVSALVGALKARHLNQGETLFKQGEPGDSMVIVGSGRLSVRVAKAPGKPAVEVATVFSGNTVGEMSCVDPALRSATVACSRPAVVFEVERSMLRAIQSHAPAVAVAIVGGATSDLTKRIRNTNDKIEKEMSVRGLTSGGNAGSDAPLPSRPAADGGKINLRQLSSLKVFSNAELAQLVKVAPAARYADGQVLCREGERAESCFILARGQVDVLKRMGGVERRLATLNIGVMVGQMALVDAAPRSATIRARGEVVVLELQRRAFNKLLEMISPLGIRFQEQIAIAGIRQLRTANQRLATLLENRPAPTPQVPRAPAAARPGLASPHARRPPTSPPRPASGFFKGIPKGAPVGGDSPLPKRPITTEATGDDDATVLAFMQAALGEWGMSMSDLDTVEHVRLPGQMSVAEKKSRGF